jgi:hypothetical protein
MSGHWQGTAWPWLDLYDGAGPAEPAEQRALADDKRHVAEMAPRWRQQRQQAAEEAFQQWKAERQRRADDLFAELHGDQQFPTLSEILRGRRP